MNKKLSLTGNMWHIYLAKPLIQLLGYNPETTRLLCTYKNNSLYFTKISDEEINKLENPLIKKLCKRGRGHTLSITQPILELLDINPEVDYINIDIQDDILIIKKAS